MSIEIAGSAAELTRDTLGIESLKACTQTIDIYLYFFSQSSGRGWLSVRLGKHSHRSPFAGQRIQFVDKAYQRRAEDVGNRIGHAHGHGRIIYVLRSQSEVNEFLVILQTKAVELLLDKILHCLDIVVGDLLDFLDTAGTFKSEILRRIDGTQRREHR